MCQAVTVNQAPGFAGTPSRGQVTAALANASCVASSASWRSLRRRASVATTAGHSSRKACSSAVVLTPGSVTNDLIQDGGWLHWPDLDGAEATERHACRPLEGGVQVGRLDEVEAKQMLLGLDEG